MCVSEFREWTCGRYSDLTPSSTSLSRAVWVYSHCVVRHGGRSGTPITSDTDRVVAYKDSRGLPRVDSPELL